MPWKPGQSGNPKGRPRGQSLREALRRRLIEPDPNAPDRSRFDQWAEKLIDQAEQGIRDMLDVFKFLEGPHPTEPPQVDEIEAKPRIAIPGSPRCPGRPKAKGRARTRKPAP